METTEKQKKPWQELVSTIALYASVILIIVAILQALGVIQSWVEAPWKGALGFGIIAFAFDRVAKLSK